MPKIADAVKNSEVLRKLGELPTLNTSDPVIKKFIDDSHKQLMTRLNKLPSRDKFDFVTESRVIKILSQDSSLDSRACARKINSIYGTSLHEEDILRVFRRSALSTMENRQKLFNWSDSVAEAFAQALISKTEKDFKAYKAKLPDRSEFHRRVVVLTIYTKYSELNIYGDAETLEQFGNLYAKYFLFDLNELLATACNVRDARKKKTAQTELEQLKSALKKNEMEVADLQEDFEKRLEENRQNEMMDFFAGLNSNRYGNILDAVLSARQGIRELKRKGIVLPPEISGLFVLVNQMAQFIRDNEINPIMSIGMEREMTLAEVESCEYEGTPFKNYQETKRVKVISPGWFYKSKDIKISRPRLIECKDD